MNERESLMKQIHVRLGPLALLLTVIVICMTVLGLLALTTARGDLSMARRYAEAVDTRYSLEAKGQAFLWETAKDPGALNQLERDKNGTFWRILSENGMSLRIGLAGKGRGFRVVSWQFIQESWEPKEDIGGLWNGG